MTEPSILQRPHALARPVLFDQQWLNLTFLHWPVDPAAIAPFFPRGSRPDVVDGVSYVGLVPFQMRGAGPGAGLPVPYFGTFAETNVRLYSIDKQGRQGVVFRSLETQRLSIVGLTRPGLGLPYTWSWMNINNYGSTVTYQSRRRWPNSGLRSHLTCTIGEPVIASGLQMWLTARWGLHTSIAGRSFWIPNEHEPWPLQQAEVVELRDELVAAAGITPIGPALPALYSKGVSTRFGRPSLL